MKEADPRFLYYTQDIIYYNRTSKNYYLARIKDITSSAITLTIAGLNMTVGTKEANVILFYASPENKTELLLKGEKLYTSQI